MTDCAIAINYLTEQERLCTYFYGCHSCPLSVENNSTNFNCINFQRKFPEKAIEIVQKWSDEHPMKTYKDDFLERFPNAYRHPDGRPAICRNLTYGLKAIPCPYNGKSCADCWGEVMPETE